MRKRKINFSELPDFYNYKRFRDKNRNVSGYIYYLCYKLSDEERVYLMTQYHNTELAHVRPQYAPEIVHDVLIVYDKCIR
jgi:hypothetical protein